MSENKSPTDNKPMHTLYLAFSRKLSQAVEAIKQTRNYLDPKHEHYLPNYITQLKDKIAEGASELTEKLRIQQERFTSFFKRSEAAKLTLFTVPSEIKKLENQNQVYLAPPEKRAEYLYVVDKQTCEASCVSVDLETLDVSEKHRERFVFKDEDGIELSEDNHTDAVRVWFHNVTLENLRITDLRDYEEAHRDAIQLIPPPLLEEVELDNRLIRLADQMVPTILANTEVRRCVVKAPSGPLQGIFASDGLQRNLCICDNDILTRGEHSISIAGMLSGEITGNTLRQAEGGKVPRIRLFPARVGGNMADDGVVSIMSFNDTADATLKYGAITQSNNQVILNDGTKKPLKVEDLRSEIPDDIAKMAIGIQNLRYSEYIEAYGEMTLSDFLAKDRFGAEKLREWLETRTKEFTSGQRIPNSVLPAVSHEQRSIGRNYLKPALDALRDGSANKVRLGELQHTPMRSFAMKRLAILYADLVPLKDVAPFNQRRDQMLKFIVEPQHLRKAEQKPVAEAQG